MSPARQRVQAATAQAGNTVGCGGPSDQSPSAERPVSADSGDVPEFVPALAAQVPPRGDGDKTTGLMVAQGQQRLLRSGVRAPVSDPGHGLTDRKVALSWAVRNHVEGHVAALMRERDGPNDVVLYLNKSPCNPGELSCDTLLPDIIPRGARLTVHVVDGHGKQIEQHRYRGRWERP